MGVRAAGGVRVTHSRVCAPPCCPCHAAPPSQGRKRKKSDLDRDLEEGEAGPDVRELALLQSQMLEVRSAMGPGGVLVSMWHATT